MSIYWNGYDQTELEQEIADLKAQARRGGGLFNSQSEGGASFTKDLMTLRNKLEAAVHVLNRKYGSGPDHNVLGVGVADFSNVEIS